jgi:hypothetical protein
MPKSTDSARRGAVPASESATILHFPGVDSLPMARAEDCEESMMDVAREIVRMGSKQLEEKVRKMLETGSDGLLRETDMALMETLVKFVSMGAVIRSARRLLNEAAASVGAPTQPAA